jgi:hypothetical protein
MTESVGKETTEKYWCFFCFVIGTDRMFQLDTTLKKKLGYVGCVYAVTKMTL